jgi:uncharacterized oligopeptide transporter (OPT) family protein
VSAPAPLDAPAPEKPRAPGAPELTFRALLAGALIGALLAAGNVYIALKTGVADAGFIAASITGFALFAGARRFCGQPYGALENNITQTTASSAGQMVFTAGLVGAIPALAMLGAHPPAWALAVWGFALALGGIVVGLALRERLIVVERLPFPTGVATAQVIEALQASRGALTRAWALLVAGLGSMILVWFRDGRPSIIPSAVLIPGLALGLAPSPMLLGTGMLVGVRVGLSLLAGAVVAWALLLPALVRAHLVPPADFTAQSGFLLWPAVALMVAAGMTALAADWRVFASALGDLTSLTRRRAAPLTRPTGNGRAGLLLGAGVLFAVVALGRWVFGMSYPLVALGLVAAVVLAVVSSRATGETDIAPITQMGQITQVGAAMLAPGQAAGGIASSTVAGGSASHSASLLWALRAGHQLGANPRHQTLAQILGAAVGSAVSVPTYLLLERAWGIATPALPAPAAVTCKAIADFARLGSAAMVSEARTAAVVAAVAGCALALAERTRLRHLVPSPMAMSVGFLVPAPFSVTICLGALLLEGLRRARPSFSEDYALPIAAGGLAGESLMGVVVAALLASGVLGR